jgi:hypothetical protein
MFWEVAVEELLERVAGVDIGRRELRVCAWVPDEASGAPTEIIESWGTTTPDLLNLVVRLRGLGVTHVAMESTGVYWKALYYLCEDDFSVLLVNAAHVKHVPGRKTDLLTELSGRSCGRCVQGAAGLARFAARDQRWGCAAGAVRAGAAAAGVA